MSVFKIFDREWLPLREQDRQYEDACNVVRLTISNAIRELEFELARLKSDLDNLNSRI